ECARINYSPVADHTGARLVQYTRRYEMQYKPKVLNPHGVTGVVAALIPRDYIEIRSENIDDLTLAFIAPLTSYDNYLLHIPYSIPNRLNPQPEHTALQAFHAQTNVQAHPLRGVRPVKRQSQAGVLAEGAIDHSRDVVLRCSPDDPLSFGPVFKDDHGRYAFDAIPLAGQGTVVYIEVEELRLPVVLLGYSLDCRSQLPARLTPLGPEVDKDRLIRLEDLLLERLVRNFAQIIVHHTLQKGFG